MPTVIRVFKNQINKLFKLNFENRKCLPDEHFDPNVILLDIANICKFAFDQDFCDFGSQTVPLFMFQQNFSNSLKASSIILKSYDDYLIEKDGLTDFLKKYPVIVPLLDKVFLQNIRFLEEIKKHFVDDAEEISAVFNNRVPTGRITNVTINQGDVHNGGRSTVKVLFECGLKLIYKPRSGGMDEAFNVFISRISVETGIRLKTVATLNKGEYFWMEFIEQLAVTSSTELNKYYERCGSLLAISYLIGGSDLHFENIIAHGDFPVLIDLECLFGATDQMKAGLHSVYNTGLVPLFSYEGEKSEPVDLSGFGACGTQMTGIENWKWEDIGTDAQRLCKEMGAFTAMGNQPVFNGEIISPEKYYNELVDGFDKTCRWFIRNKYTVEEEDSIFSVFKNREIRVVIRNTSDYKIIIDNSLTAKSLRGAEDRYQDITTSLLNFKPYVYLKSTVKEQILRKELVAVQNLDIPLFVANTSETKLYESSNVCAEGFFEVSPYKFTIEKIKNFDEKEMNWQIDLIKSAFLLRYSTNITMTGQVSLLNKVAYDESVIFNEVEKIGAILKSRAIKNEESYIWNSYTASEGNRIVFNTLGTGFYDGNLGIAFFLNALYKITGDREYSSISDAIMNSECAKCLTESYETDLSFSGGLGGLIYALTKTGKPADAESAISIVARIKIEDINNDAKLDIMSGSAGLLLAMALLYNATASSIVFDSMILAGDHLVMQMIKDESSGLCAWKSDFFTKSLTGFSHGAAGISCALLTLYQFSGKTAYKDAFYAAVKFETFYINSTSDNWLDLRRNEPDQKTMWCHGASGIGLARLHAYKLLNDPELLVDIEMAIAATRQSLLNSVDFYCCGNMGRIDFLIEASLVLGRPELLAESQVALMHIINNKTVTGFYQTYETAGVSLENPSLFRGLAGIGYTLLRSINSFKNPCIGLLQ